MICPRCNAAEIAEDGRCELCGYAPDGGVIVQQAAVDEIAHVVQQATAGRFHVEALLRLGERSLVYLAHEVAEDRLVALKVIPIQGGVTRHLARAFERQAALAAPLSHPHIVSLHAYGTSGTFLWYSMEHMRGQSLADLLRESGPLDFDRCVNIAYQIASALSYAHEAGVPHGNLKPSNVFLDTFLDDPWVQVGDFAILGTFGRPALSGNAGPWLRLPEYMAPEQFYARAATADADQYTLAIMVYQCLSGTLPFIGDSFEEVAHAQALDPPPPLADLRQDLPAGAAEAVSRALTKRPVDRFASVLDFVAALAAPPVALSEPPEPSQLIELPELAEPPAPPQRRTPAPPFSLASTGGPRLPRGTSPAAPAAPAEGGPEVLLVPPETPGRRRRLWLLILVVVLAIALGVGAVLLTASPR